jgi:hypothetical protein
MSGRRAPIERLVDMAVAVPVAVAVAARQLVPIGVTRLERRIARDLMLLQRYARRGSPAVAPAPDTTAVDTALDSAARATTSLDVVDVVRVVDVAEPAVGADLPIDGYDQLSARQIVDRLPSLSADELAIIEAHERTRRRRQTVLARIAQLS